MRRGNWRLVFVVLCGVGAALRPAGAQAPEEPSDLDAFMAEVLARRDENWKRLQQYLLDERERLQIAGPTGVPLWGDERTYTWFIRDGFFVRSPLTANGVAIADRERRRAEDEYLTRVRTRDRRDLPDVPPPQGFDAPAAGRPREAATEFGGLLAQSRAPQFIDKAYFLRFTFEPGRYAFVGRETLEGVEVLRIEYYPARLFSHEQDAEDRRRAAGTANRGEDVEAARERLMNKGSLVTLWVAPAPRQIVKYTFDNVALDFLPAAWLFRVTDLTATMTMAEAFPAVWLPRAIEMHFGAMLAIGPIDARYRVQYEQYREAAATGRLLPAGR